ncbi:hypothetical protein NDU88_003937 [Pleurodeles waltl]|uniref:Uncharacterized protein n=1 Tax=Pleurodeles waltl TaxID=8319 RepID=A0AAV7WQJ1_PLEWA|nr:hypothetical protein NDU88_003937 [Pleurodeles waltl]
MDEPTATWEDEDTTRTWRSNWAIRRQQHAEASRSLGREWPNQNSRRNKQNKEETEGNAVKTEKRKQDRKKSKEKEKKAPQEVKELTG